MGKTSVTILKVLFILTTLNVVATATLVALTFALDYAGFNLSVISPGCTGNNYLNIKLAGIYMILRVHTIAAFLALMLSSSIFIIVIKKICLVCSSSEDENNNKEIALYILTCLTVLFMLSNGGGHISLYFDNKSCSILKESTVFILLLVSSLSLLLSFISFILVIALYCYCEDKQEIISLDNIRKNRELRRQEQAMSKQFEMQAKQYISNNFNKKQDLMQGLLKQQYNAYNNTDITKNLKEGDNQFNQTSQPNQATQPNHTPKSQLNQSYPFQLNGLNNPNQRNQLKKGSLNTSEGNKNIFEYKGDDQYNNLNPIDQSLLFVKDDDNISEKFDENNFELEQDLQKAMLDLQEDLSPLQLKQLMNFTKSSFQLKSNNKNSLVLQKEYQPNMRITINFAKIKEHKLNVQKQKKNMEKQPGINQNINNKQEDKKQDISVYENKPINQQLAKILKITFYNNSNIKQEAYRPIQNQTQCPISRYLEEEQSFEVVQSNDKGKSKKIEYSKQQVIFSKKRQQMSESQQKQRATSKHRFNETQLIKVDRLLLFGFDWVMQQQRIRKQKQREEKSKRRKLVDVIRSKYYN